MLGDFDTEKFGTKGYAVVYLMFAVAAILLIIVMLDLLIAIMDPNRESQANFLSYSIVTDEGRVLTGIITGETATAVTLRKAKGEEEIILRSQIDIMKSNGISLMPAGLEKELKPEDIDELIAFIKSLEGASK